MKTVLSSAFLALCFLMLSRPASPQAMSPYDIAGSDFEQKVIAASAARPVVVMFRSGSCEPCAAMVMQTPMMAFAAFGGNVEFFTVDIDAEPALAQRFGVTEPPRIVVFKAGEAVATRDGPADQNPLFQFFAGLASEGAKEAYQATPEEMKPKRPEGAELETIGSWKVDRESDGTAYGLSADRYVRQNARVQVGPWNVEGDASLSLRYSAEDDVTVWDVLYHQDITRDATDDEDHQTYGIETIKVEMPGKRVSMQLDGDMVANLPDPLELQADQVSDAIDNGQVVGGYLHGVERQRYHLVVANRYLVEFGREATPASFEKRFVAGKTMTFSIDVEGQQVVLAEIELEDTQKALQYLKEERIYAWHRYNEVKAKP